VRRTDHRHRAQSTRRFGQQCGATWGTSFDEFPDAGWDKVLAVNLKAPFTLTRLARPLLEKASTAEDPARVINIGSIDGMIVPGFGNYSYSASKAAIHHLTRHMAADLAPSILVNAIAPGRSIEDDGKVAGRAPYELRAASPALDRPTTSPRPPSLASKATAT
jgi:NAD(P)-dependent dehydrogenase (short-subunit alcohol dehydrogenase family)